MASINAPDVQTEIFYHLNDPTAIGNVKIMIFNDNRSHKLHEILKFDPDIQMTSHMIMMRTSSCVYISQGDTEDIFKIKEITFGFSNWCCLSWLETQAINQ